MFSIHKFQCTNSMLATKFQCTNSTRESVGISAQTQGKVACLSTRYIGAELQCSTLKDFIWYLVKFPKIWLFINSTDRRRFD